MLVFGTDRKRQDAASTFGGYRIFAQDTFNFSHMLPLRIW